MHRSHVARNMYVRFRISVGTAVVYYLKRNVRKNLSVAERGIVRFRTEVKKSAQGVRDLCMLVQPDGERTMHGGVLV